MTVDPANWTERQVEAARLLRGPAKNVLLYGGARSGKTRLVCEWIVAMCFVVAGLRVLILRYRRSHAKDTVWHETLLSEVLPRWGIDQELVNKSDLMIPMPHGSEIWVGGTDDSVRLEKMLGRGAGLVYLNESSQISYDAAVLVRTRLSQALTYTLGDKLGQPWVPKMICDCNPPSPTHWLHRVFIDHTEPKDGHGLSPDRYVAMKINPIDNMANLPAGYLEDLDELPQQERDRFKFGLWTTPEGAIFPEYSEDLLIDEAPECEKYYVGVDMVTYAAVLIGVQRYVKGDSMRTKAYCVDEWPDEPGRINALAHELNSAITEKWSDYNYTAIIDHNLGKAGTREIDNSKMALKGQGSVEAGISVMQTAMHNGEFFVCRRCTVLHYQLENYHRDDAGGVVKQDDHHVDATRMVFYTAIRRRKEIVVE